MKQSNIFLELAQKIEKVLATEGEWKSIAENYEKCLIEILDDIRSFKL